MARLTEKQKRFVSEYLKDLNATQAAIRAGYSKKTAYSIGDENLKKPDVQKALKAAIDRRSERTQITQDMVLRELAGIAFANGADFVVVENGTLQVRNTAELPAEKRTAIAMIREGREGIEVKTHDKVKALELLGKHLGLFDRQTDAQGDDALKAFIRATAPGAEIKKLYEEDDEISV
jgi:phage terminase small subunit